MLVITVPVISIMVTKVILCMLVISATFGKLLHSEFGSINTLLPPTCVLSSLTNEDSSSPSSLNYFYKYSVLSKLYAG